MVKIPVHLALLMLLVLMVMPSINAAEHPSHMKPKKTVIFAVGVEGSYHHYLVEVFRKIDVGVLCTFNPKVVQDKTKWEDKYLAWANEKKISGRCFPLRNQRNTIIHAIDSFPEGRPVTSHSFPNIRGFLHLNATGKINLRLLYLNRDLIDATVSSLIRFKGGTHTLGKYVIVSMNTFAETIYRVPHFVFSDSDDEPTRLSNLQRLFAGIAEPADVQKAVEANPFKPTNHTSPEELAIRHVLESIVGPHMKNWPAELTRGTVFVNLTADSRVKKHSKVIESRPH